MTEQSPPKHSRIADWYRGADLLDAFAVPMPGAADRHIRSVGQEVLGDPAPWFKALLSIRDGIVSRLGLRTSSKIRNAHVRSDRIDLFPILSAHDGEIVLGEDDKHLDVRISLIVQKGLDGPDVVVATTAVRCHNRLGRVYLLAIRPFHRLAVRSYLRRAAEADFAGGGPSHPRP